MKTKYKWQQIFVYGGLLLLLLVSCPDPGEGPGTTPTPTPGPQATPEPSRTLRVTVTVDSAGAVVDADREIWIRFYTDDDNFPADYYTTANGGTIIITDIPASVFRLTAIYDPTGGWNGDEGLLLEETNPGSLVEFYNDLTYFEEGVDNPTAVINIAEGATEDVSMILEDRNLIDPLLPTTGSYTIEVYADNSATAGDSILYLYDDSLNLLRYNNDNSMSDFFSSFDYNLEADTTYYLKVTGYDSSTQFGYALSVYDNSGPRPVAISNNGDGSTGDSWEDENDVPRTAESIENVGDIVYRNIEATGDVDWFTITIN
jgi:hypothetical protein